MSGVILLKNNDVYGRYKRYQQVRDAVWQTLIDYKVVDLPVSLYSICKMSEIKLIKNSVSHSLNENESGMSVFQHGIWYVIYDDSELKTRTRFTIAHELGHIFLGHEMKNGLYTRKNNMFKPTDETEADMFAARLLAPACVLWGINAQTAEQIASVCNISHEAAQIRAERMEILRKRGKFLTSPLEQQVYKQFENYIKNNRL